MNELARRFKEAEAREAGMVEALRKNHAWHQETDEYGGYPDSYLCTVNTEALSLASPRAKQILAVVASMEKLLVWDKKYPKGRYYNGTEWQKCECELTEIIDAVRALK